MKKQITTDRILKWAGIGMLVGIVGFIVGGMGIAFGSGIMLKVGLGLIALGGIIWS